LQAENKIKREHDQKTGTPYYSMNPLRDAIRISPDLRQLIQERRKRRIPLPLLKDEATLMLSQEALKRINNPMHVSDTLILDEVILAFFIDYLWVWYRELEFFMKPKPDPKKRLVMDYPPPSELDPNRSPHIRGFKSVEEICKAALDYMVTWICRGLRDEGFAVEEEQVMNVVLRLRDQGAYAIEKKTVYQIQPYDGLLDTSKDNSDYLGSLLGDLLKRIDRRKASTSRGRGTKGRTSEWLYRRIKYVRQRSVKRKNVERSRP